MSEALPTNVPGQEDAEDWSLPGLELQHDVHALLGSWRDWDEIARRLTDAGADLHALTMSRQADGVNVRFRIKKISAGRARTFCAALQADGFVCRVSVEHLMLSH